MKKQEELKNRLHIDKPCHENWEEMTETERGKFCGVCSTEVIDFERMSEEELIAFFENYSPSKPVCGHLKVSKPATRWRAAAASVLIAASVFACKPAEKNNSGQNNSTEIVVGKVRAENDLQSALKGEGFKGYATKNGHKIAYASVSIISGNELLVKMQTKTDGKFELKYPDYDPQKHPDLRLRLSHMEYEGVEFPLSADTAFEQGKNYELGKPTQRKGKIRIE